jgi:hypothetical protein
MTKNKKFQPQRWQHYDERNDLERNCKENNVGKYKKLETFLSIIPYKAETMQKEEEEEVLKLLQNVHSLHMINNVQPCNFTYRHYGDCMQTQVPIHTSPFYSRQHLNYVVCLNFPEHIYSIYILSPQTCSATCPALMPTLMSRRYAARKHKFIMLPSWHCDHQPTADLYVKHSIFKNNTIFLSNHR